MESKGGRIERIEAKPARDAMTWKRGGITRLWAELDDGSVKLQLQLGWG